MPVLTEDARDHAERLLGHHFARPGLLLEALTHSSAADARLSSNERLEFLGDAVLELAVCDVLFREFPTLREGDLTTLKSAVVSRRTCAAVARESGLIDLLLVGKGIINRREMPGSLAAAVYESVVAALYLDGGYDVARAYIERTLRPHIDALADSNHGYNYKAQLHAFAQARHKSLPEYDVLDEQGPDHNRCFHVAVRLDGTQVATAWGPSKKTAEQKAALNALRVVGEIDADGHAVAVDGIDRLAPQVLTRP